MATLDELEGRDEFVARHIGPNAAEQAAMCAAIGVTNRDELIAQTVPAGIRLKTELPLGESMTEHAALAKLKQTVIQNGNVFAELMNAVRVCSLGQITNALFEVGGQYRRSM